MILTASSAGLGRGLSFSQSDLCGGGQINRSEDEQGQLLDVVSSEQKGP